MVRLEADISDIDSFMDNEKWNVQKKVIDIGEDAVRYAKENGNYQNHTFNLRNSNDYDVDEDANLTLFNDATSPQGFQYASVVESKGYDVLSGAALYAEKKLKDEFE